MQHKRKLINYRIITYNADVCISNCAIFYSRSFSIIWLYCTAMKAIHYIENFDSNFFYKAVTNDEMVVLWVLTF